MTGVEADLARLVEVWRDNFTPGSVLKNKREVAVRCTDVGDRSSAGELIEVSIRSCEDLVEMNHVAEDVAWVPVDFVSEGVARLPQPLDAIRERPTEFFDVLPSRATAPHRRKTRY